MTARTRSTITTGQGTRVRIAKTSRVIVRRVYRSGLTVSITDGHTTHDVNTYATEPEALAEARRLAEATKLPAPDSASGTARLIPDSRSVSNRGHVQPELPFA